MNPPEPLNSWINSGPARLISLLRQADYGPALAEYTSASAIDPDWPLTGFDRQEDQLEELTGLLELAIPSLPEWLPLYWKILLWLPLFYRDQAEINFFTSVTTAIWSG